MPIYNGNRKVDVSGIYKGYFGNQLVYKHVLPTHTIIARNNSDTSKIVSISGGGLSNWPASLGQIVPHTEETTTVQSDTTLTLHITNSFVEIYTIDEQGGQRRVYQGGPIDWTFNSGDRYCKVYVSVGSALNYVAYSIQTY